MSDKGWKAFERRMSRDMRVERIPVTGERCGSDASTSMFCFQFKNRRMLPTWLFAWLDGITGTAKRDDKIGILVLKIPRMKDSEALVVLRWSDWVALHGTDQETAVANIQRQIAP
jgi:hypothetical protein